jgi:hypothetical protein
MTDYDEIFSAFGFDDFVGGNFGFKFDTTTRSGVPIPGCTSADADELEGQKYLDELLKQARDDGFDFLSPEAIEADVFSGFIRQRDLDEEIDIFPEKSTEVLIDEIINGLDDITLSSSVNSSYDSDESDSETEQDGIKSAEASFPPRATSQVQTDNPRSLKRTNQDLKRDALFQPLEHLYSQK